MSQTEGSRRLIVNGALWNAGNNILMRMAAIAVTAVVARLLTPADFGAFALASAVFLVVTSLAEMGLGTAITRSVDDPDGIAPTVTTVAMATSTVLAVVMAVAAPTLAELVGSPAAAEPIRILSICLFLSGFFAVPGAQMARDFRQGRLLVANLVGFVPANVVLVLLALHGSGAVAFAWSRVVGQLLTGLVMVASVHRRHLPGYRPGLILSLVTFGLPLALANLVNWSLLNADYVIIGHALTDAQVGIYLIAFTVAGWSTAVLGSVLNSIVVPALARVSPDPRARGDATLKAARLVALVAAPIGALTVGLARPMVLAVYGNAFAPAADVLEVLAAYGVIFALSLLLVNVLVAGGRTGRLLVVQLVWLGVLAPAMTYAVRWGLVGVAAVHVVVIVLVVLPSYLAALRGVVTVRRGDALHSVGAPVAGAVVAGLVAKGASLIVDGIGGPGTSPWWPLAVGGLAGTLTYLALLLRQLVDYLPSGLVDRWRGRARLAAQRQAAQLPQGLRRAVQLVPRGWRTLGEQGVEPLRGWDTPLVGPRASDLDTVHLEPSGRSDPPGVGRRVEAGGANPAFPGGDDGHRLRCLLVTGSLDAGGMDAFVDFLVRRLPDHGMTTEVLVAADSLDTADGRFADALRSDGWQVRRAGPDDVTDVVADLEVDVVSLHGAPDWAVSVLGIRGLPVVETLHGVHLFSGVEPDLVAARAAHLTHLVSVSEMVREQYLAVAPGTEPGRVTTVPNGVTGQGQPARVRTEARLALGLVDDDVLFVSLARYCLQKNTYGLVSAFDEVTSRHPRARLVVAGRNDDATYLAQVRHLHAGLAHPDRIHLRDHYQRSPVLLAAADCFVLDSFFEGWALASMEALTAGVPVVLSDVAGAAEQLDVDDPPGRLVTHPLGDPYAATWPAMSTARFVKQSNRDELAGAMLDVADHIMHWRARRVEIASTSSLRFSPDLCLSRHAEILTTAASGLVSTARQPQV